MKDILRNSFGFPLEDIFTLKEKPKTKKSNLYDINDCDIFLEEMNKKHKGGKMQEQKHLKIHVHSNSIVYYNNNLAECPLCLALEKIRELESDCEALKEDLQIATVGAPGSL